MTGAGASWVPGKANCPPPAGFSRFPAHWHHRPATAPRPARGADGGGGGEEAVGAPAGPVPSALGSAPVLLTLATFEAETSRRRAAAFMPDSAMVEMLLIKGSGLVGRMLEPSPNACAR